MAQNLNNDLEEGIPQSQKTNEEIMAELMGGYQAPLKSEEPTPLPEETPTDEPVTETPGEPVKRGRGRPRKNPGPPPEPVITSELISGALFLTLVDLLLPFLIEVVNNRFSKIKINSEDLKLTEKQKKEITPISDAVVKSLNIQGNPVWLMIIALGGIYGINTAALRAMKKEEIKSDAKTKS